MTNNPNPSLMTEERAREVLAQAIDAWPHGDRDGRTDRQSKWAQWSLAITLKALEAAAEEARAAEQELPYRKGFRDARYLFDPSVSASQSTPEEDDHWGLFAATTIRKSNP